MLCNTLHINGIHVYVWHMNDVIGMSTMMGEKYFNGGFPCLWNNKNGICNWVNTTLIAGTPEALELSK